MAISEGAPLSPAQLLDPAVIEDPYDFYRKLVAEAPVWCLPGSPVVLVSSFEAVSQVVNRPGDFSSNLRGLLHRSADGEVPEVMPFDGGPGTDVLATADPPTHTVHRRSVFPELVARRMVTLRDEIEALADERLDGLSAEGSAEFMDAVANAVPIRVVSRLIGFEADEPDALLQAAFDSTAMLGATEPLDVVLGLMERTFAIAGWIDEQLIDAERNGRDGILGAVAAAVADGEVDHAQGTVIIHTLLSAGGESTTSLLGSAVHLLATQPELQARLRADASLLTPFIEEVLRLESPFRFHLRHAPRDTGLCGVSVPAGSTVLLLWGAANRDPSEFDRPDEVVLDRQAPRHHVGFGRGIHLCVGAPLARLEAEVVLTRLLERTSSIQLDPDSPPVRVNSLMVRRFASLPLRLNAA